MASYNKIEAYRNKVHKHVIRARDEAIKLELPFIALTCAVREVDEISGKTHNFERLVAALPPGKLTPTVMLCALALLRYFKEVPQSTVDELMNLLAKHGDMRVVKEDVH